MSRPTDYSMPPDEVLRRARSFDPTIIQTRYNHRFYRSRLEARWAVFFDAMDITFEYEPEGFRLPDGSGYLPDFYLPQVKWFAEVKPNLHILHATDKARCFATMRGCDILMLDGPPSFKSYTGFIHLPPSGMAWLEFSLDIADGRNEEFYRIERRLFSDPWYNPAIPAEKNFSHKYIDSVEASLSESFE